MVVRIPGFHEAFGRDTESRRGDGSHPGGALIYKPWRIWQIEKEPRDKAAEDDTADSQDPGAADTTDNLDEAMPLLNQMYHRSRLTQG